MIQKNMYGVQQLFESGVFHVRTKQGRWVTDLVSQFTLNNQAYELIPEINKACKNYKK